jgi:hypothetical protein
LKSKYRKEERRMNYLLTIERVVEIPAANDEEARSKMEVILACAVPEESGRFLSATLEDGERVVVTKRLGCPATFY